MGFFDKFKKAAEDIKNKADKLAKELEDSNGSLTEGLKNKAKEALNAVNDNKTTQKVKEAANKLKEEAESKIKEGLEKKKSTSFDAFAEMAAKLEKSIEKKPAAKKTTAKKTAAKKPAAKTKKKVQKGPK